MVRSIGAITSNKRLVVTLGALLVATAVGTPTSYAVDSKKVVKVTARTTRPTATGRQFVTLTLDVDKGWYIYANPVGNKDLQINQTSVVVKGLPTNQVKIRFPKGKVKQEKEFGNYFIYQGKISIVAEIQHRSTDRGPVQLELEFQACHVGGRCLQPAKVAFKLR